MPQLLQEIQQTNISYYRFFLAAYWSMGFIVGMSTNSKTQAFIS